MNTRIKLLDCTLRDGGSINNWNFGSNNIFSILNGLNQANIDIIEIGFLQNNIFNNSDKTITSDIKYFNNHIQKIFNKNFKAVAMIDTGMFDIDLLPDKKETLIDGIRLMFKKSQIPNAQIYANLIKEKGYELSLNPVSVTTYNDDDLELLFNFANNISPNIIYLVDTYGLMNSTETIEYFEKFDNNINKSVEIGYHTHNNLQLAFSNSIDIVNYKTNRNIIIDASLYGMGKRAGNTNTELIAFYLNNIYKNKYNINKIYEIIDLTIDPLHKKYNWGYSIFHYIAAINKCHSDYVTYLYNEKNISITKINNILNKIEKEQKLTFNKEYIDNLII